MKNIVRAFALTLVVTGAFASSHINTSNANPVVGKVSFVPIPSCPYNDPNGCNMYGHNK